MLIVPGNASSVTRGGMQRIDEQLEAPYRVGMMFSRDLRDPVARGEVTVSIRLWSRSQVKVGNRYSTAGVIIEIDSLELLPFSAVTEDDLAASGEADREVLRVRAAHSGPIDDDTLVHRVEFHVV